MSNANKNFPLIPDWSARPETGATDDLVFDALLAGSPEPWRVYKKRDTYSFKYRCNRAELQSVLNHFTDNGGRMGSPEGFKIYTPETLMENTPEAQYIKTVRYRDDTLEVSHLGANLFDLTVNFIEVNKCADNMLDSIEKTAYLYAFEFGNGIAPRYFTNWGLSVTTFLQVYRAADITHAELEYTEEMLAEELSITLAGSVARLVLQNIKSSMPITVTIQAMDMVSVAMITIKPVFQGVVVDVETGVSGELTLKLSSQLRIFNREVGRCKLQRQCNHILYGPACGLNKDSFTFTGSPVTLDGYNATVDIPGNNAKDDAYFSGAIILQGVKRYVILSDKPVGGYREIVTDAPLRDADFELSLWCDKSIADCSSKFGNANNFGGCPWLPNNNPLDLARNDSSVGKK